VFLGVLAVGRLLLAHYVLPPGALDRWWCRHERHCQD
jgi:hypothetical protein